MQAFTFGRSLARLVSPEDNEQRVTFADVAGAKEAKEELTEIVDFLKNPKKFIQIGARIPKGVLLMGCAEREADHHHHDEQHVRERGEHVALLTQLGGRVHGAR